MEDEVNYSNYGYQADDERMIAEFLKQDWSLEFPSIHDESQLNIMYNEEEEVAQYDFRSSSSRIKIVATETVVSPMGISYDSESRKRAIAIYISARGREEAIAIADECRRIIHLHRNRPGNMWDMMYAGNFKPMYPNYNFYQGVLIVQLKNFCRLLPDPLWP